MTFCGVAKQVEECSIAIYGNQTQNKNTAIELEKKREDGD